MNGKRFLIMMVVLALSLTGLGIVAAQDEGSAWLGVAITDTDGGVTVGDVVPGSPAAEAGLGVGDIILAVDETEVASTAELIELIQTYSPGDTVTLSVESEGETTDVVVTLGERPEDLEAPSVPEFGPGNQMRGMLNFLGMEVEVTETGMQINAIDPESPLVDSGLQEGDLITAINGEPITGLNPRELMQSLMSEETLTLTVERDGEELEVELDLAALMEEAGGMPMQPGMGMRMGQRPTQLGVQFTMMSPEVAEEQGIEMQEGALIIEVYEDTPAAEAGLLADDIVTAVDDDLVDEERTLADRLYAYEEGDVVTLTVQRGGEEMELEVTLGPSQYGRGGMFGFGPGGRFHFCPGGMEGFEDFFNMPPFSPNDEVPVPETPAGDESSA